MPNPKNGGKRRKFTPEFKAEALRLLSESSITMHQLAKNLGINPVLLSVWRSKARKKEELAPGALTEQERLELARLRRENEQLKKERDFLKKSEAFFAKKLGRN